MRIARLLPLLGAITALGCQSDPTPVKARDASVQDKLVAVAKGYNESSAGLGHTPKTDAELRPFLERFGPPDDVLRSPTDDQSFFVNFKANAPGDVVACERVGKDNKRWAVNLKAEVFALSDADFGRLQSTPAGAKPKIASTPEGGHQQVRSLKGIAANPAAPTAPTKP